MSHTTIIGYSRHRIVKNKPKTKPLLNTLGANWDPVLIRDPAKLIETLKEDVKAGVAVAPGIFQQHDDEKLGCQKVHHKFVTAQFIMIDYDVDDDVSWNKLKSGEFEFFNDHALFAYTSASHTAERNRFRVVCALAEPIEDIKEYNDTFMALRNYLREASYPCDDDMMRAIQCAFGNDKAELVHFNSNNRLPNLEAWKPKPEIKARSYKSSNQTAKTTEEEITLKADDPCARKKVVHCLQYITPRGLPASGTYPPACNTLMAMFNDFGFDETLDIIEEAGWHGLWDEEAKMNSFRQCDEDGYHLPTIVYLAQEHADRDGTREEFDAVMRELNLDAIKEVKSIEAKDALAKLFQLGVEATVSNEANITFKTELALFRSRYQFRNEEIYESLLNLLDDQLRFTLNEGAVQDAYASDFFEDKTFFTDEASAASRQPILPGFIPQKSDGIIAGAPGTGKTTAVLAMCSAIVNGTGFLDHEEGCTIDNAEILFISMDTSREDLQQSCKEFGYYADPKFQKRVHIWTKTEAKQWHLFFGSLQMLADWLSTHPNVKLVVFDTLQSICGKYIDIFKSEVDQWLRAVQRVCNAYGATSLWIHHTTKDGSQVAGGAEITRATSFVHMLKTVEVPNGENTYLWAIPKFRGAESRYITCERDEGNLKATDERDIYKRSCPDDVLVMMKQNAGENGVPTSALTKQLDNKHSKGAIRKAILKLKEGGYIRSEERPGQRMLHHLTAAGKRRAKEVPNEIKDTVFDF